LLVQSLSFGKDAFIDGTCCKVELFRLETFIVESVDDDVLRTYGLSVTFGVALLEGFVLVMAVDNVLRTYGLFAIIGVALLEGFVLVLTVVVVVVHGGGGGASLVGADVEVEDGIV
jgi:hypothetical protein